MDAHSEPPADDSHPVGPERPVRGDAPPRDGAPSDATPPSDTPPSDTPPSDTPPSDAPPPASAHSEPFPELGTEQGLGAGFMAAERTVGGLVLSVPSAGLGVLVFFLAGPSLGWAAGGLVMAAVVWWLARRALLGYQRRFHATAHWCLTQDELVWSHGVWWRKVITIPRSRVQHTDVTQGPLARRHDLASLVVHTAGTSYATVRLDGLQAAHARGIRDRLLAQGAADDGV